MSQTSYSMNQRAGIAGALADIGPKFVATYANAQGAAIPFGVVVALGTSATKCKLPTASADKPLGVSMFGHEPANDGTVGYPDASPVSVVREGTVWVTVEDAVVAEGNVFYRVTAAGPQVYGAIRSDADTATAVQLPGAKFLTSASAGGLAQVRLSGL